MISREIFLEGANSYRDGFDVYEQNPYKRIDIRADGRVRALQPEAAIFFNGWNFKERQNTKRRYSIFLDDFRLPNWINFIKYPDGVSWHITRNYYEFTACIQEWGPPELISFDYDLDWTGFDCSYLGPYKTGLDCARWMIGHFNEWKIPPPMLAIHSFNAEGRQRIGELLINWVNSKLSLNSPPPKQ